MIRYPGPPDWWIARGGAPARCLGDCRRHGGLPSFEHEDGKLVVYDLLLAFPESDGGIMLLPRWYGTACLIAPDGMVPLHHDPKAWWVWRPMIYRRSMYGYWRMMGSQRELWWRRGLKEVAISGVDNFGMAEADARADVLLRENLSWFQRVELALTNEFRVRGAKTRNMYRIGHGDGFEIVDEVTGECVVSYCCHPEEWMPDSDVMLATKLALEDEELEIEVLENARATPVDPIERPTPQLRRARDMERELIA